MFLHFSFFVRNVFSTFLFNFFDLCFQFLVEQVSKFTLIFRFFHSQFFFLLSFLFLKLLLKLLLLFFKNFHFFSHKFFFIFIFESVLLLNKRLFFLSLFLFKECLLFFWNLLYELLFDGLSLFLDILVVLLIEFLFF